jgi:hypothetical protein
MLRAKRLQSLSVLRISFRGSKNRSVDTKIFKRGLNAYNHPDFYRQLGEQPDEITALAVTALVEKFDG